MISVVFIEGKMNHLEWISNSRVYSDEENSVLFDALSFPLLSLKLRTGLKCDDLFTSKLRDCFE